MKEMGNNDFIHTLDAVYNLCSEIKELVDVGTEEQENDGNEGFVLLSDNLQRLQSETRKTSHYHKFEIERN